MFKSLPPEMRMMLAMAGLGSPAGMIYILKRYLFPGWSYFMITLVVFGVITVVCLLGFLVTKVFGLGKKKRTSKLSKDLAATTDTGSISARAAIKSNNEKFFNAIRDMKKRTGTSVYDLPWYIVIGDSGCGKTKLVNEGGLTFSLGKPEGYQLGTLNYNWWFTEDAIFVDMAGRLCNPQEDADRREWESFLNTISRGRKGFPINGALVCVSADHLLQDSPEKVEQGANTALERLRDLQGKLGVTFATYLVITKCDKILGFMQFFDRAERDITVKNQIFGISRSGEFSTPYDPEQFGMDFDGLYERLNELRLRRLHDEADEIDLGLAYSFPEEFRQFREPLQTYMRTLFPLIKNPRAIKNLIYRGVYFTSATQEGALILKHITERLGPEAAGQFAPLDLYPNKRPHFIKDLLFRKVFPEHGLVFRNEQQAVRNRKLGGILRIGSVVLTVLLFGLVGLSSYKFGKVIGQPRDRADQTKPQNAYTPDAALTRASELGDSADTLRGNMAWAAILSLGVGTGQPVRDLNTIRAGLFERTLMKQALADVDKAFRTTPLGDPRDGPEAQAKAKVFMDALEQYLAWLGCAGKSAPADHMDYKSFKTLCAIVTDEESPIVVKKKDFEEEATEYFNVVRQTLEDGGVWGNPARLLSADGRDPNDTARRALATVQVYLGGLATLDEGHPDPVIRQWMLKRQQCGTIESSYAEMLNAAGDTPQTLEDLERFKTKFVAAYGEFSGSVSGLPWQSESSGPKVVIKPLRDAITAQRQQWLDYEEKLKKTFGKCGPTPDSPVAAMIDALDTGGKDATLTGLDVVLWESLTKNELTTQAYAKEDYEPEFFKTLVKEVYERYPYIISFKKGEGTASDALLIDPQVHTVDRVLGPISDRLAAAHLAASADVRTPEEWLDQLDQYFAHFEKAVEDSPIPALESLAEVWRPDELRALNEAYADLIVRGEARGFLEGVRDRLAGAGEWGFAEMVPEEERRESKESVYDIPIPPPAEASRPRATRGRETPAETKRPSRRRPARGRSPSRPTPRAGAAPAGPLVKSKLSIPNCVTREFLSVRGEECVGLLAYLRDFTGDYYFTSADDVKPLNEQCLDALADTTQKYMRMYVRSWATAYQSKKLDELQRLLDKGDSWQSLAERLKGRGDKEGGGRDDVGNELYWAVSEILGAVPYWSWFQDESGRWVQGAGTDDPYWSTVGDWMETAIRDEWPSQLGRFAGEAKLPADLESALKDKAPWVVLAGEFSERWRVLAKAIGACTALPNKFETVPKPEGKVLIPWGEIARLRDDARLDDEKLTGQLGEFEKQAQALLSVALTRILCDIQSRYFSDREPYDGWPYMNPAGEGPKALETVNFTDFKRFVQEVDRAWQVFESLEDRLADSGDLATARAMFYRGCRDWVGFLKLTNLDAAELPLEITLADPVKVYGKQNVQDTAQHYYQGVALDLGLCVRDDAAQMGCDPDKPLRSNTLLEEKVKRRDATWRWTARTPNKELSVALVDGRPIEGSTGSYPPVRTGVGESSELALCSYLHRYGVARDDGRWVTTHAFDLEAEFKKLGQANLTSTLAANKKIVGETFLFKLDRPLPPPILRLREAAPATN